MLKKAIFEMKSKLITVLVLLQFIPGLIRVKLCPAQSVLQEMQQEISEILELAKPSIVTISSKSSHSYSVTKDNGLLSIFSNDEEERTVRYRRLCSGLIYDGQGHIITKSNSTGDVDSLTVTIMDGSEHKAAYIGRDHDSGITVLKIDSGNLTPPRFSGGEDIALGSWAAIVGNSMGCSPSISLGIVNGLMPNGLMQISAMFSPGNNGSPIFDIQGNVIGMLIAQIDGLVADKGKALFPETGLAISMNRIQQIVIDIIESHENELGWLGIQFAGSDAATEQAEIELYQVLTKSPAHEAGLRKGDIILKYNNITLKDRFHLGELVRKTKPGSLVPINIVRGQTRLNVFARVGDRNAYFKIHNKSNGSGYYQSRSMDSQSPNLHKKANRLENEINQLKNR